MHGGYISFTTDKLDGCRRRRRKRERHERIRRRKRRRNRRLNVMGPAAFRRIAAAVAAPGLIG